MKGHEHFTKMPSSQLLDPDNGSNREGESKESINQRPSPCVNLTGLSRDGARSAFTPYRPSTVLTNLQRGNIQTETPAVLPERSIHQLAAQGELFPQHLEDLSSVDDEDEYGFTPLIWACSYGQLTTVRLLIEHGATVNSSGKHNENALLFASSNGHAHIVRELLKHGANVDATDEDGNTALMYAAFNNHALCAHELLSAGADMTIENSNWDTVYGVAVSKGSKQVQLVLEKYMLNLLTGS